MTDPRRSSVQVMDQKSPEGLSHQPQLSSKPYNHSVKQAENASDGIKNNDLFELPTSDFKMIGLLTLLAAVVRLFKIYQPSSVVFDEVHFGGFATKYIKGRFFMDVHPPLAKLLITLAGWLAGFDGNFDFKDIGKDYLEPGVPYVAMRLLPAILGVLTVPLMFLTLKAFGSRTTAATLGAAMVLFENGLTTQSRFILLDSPLVVCTAFTALTWTCFVNQHEQGPAKAFEPNWWFWLAATGLGLGATVSIKWVGLFTIGWVGCLTVLQLWVLLGDTKSITPRLWFKHFFARAFCLIIIPVTFYVSMYLIHFVCLVNPGDGDGFMSSEFQATLNSKAMQDVPVDVAFGSRVSFRHHNTQGGYLHSHAHMYPGGSKQQQVTLYPHKDENNVWTVENQTIPEGSAIKGPTAWDALAPTLFVEDGAVVKLYHIMTDRRLHSHDVRPPVTEADWQNEISAYGYEGFEGDANDLFKIEIVKSLSNGVEAKKRVRTIQTKFKLVHLMTGCVLFSHKVKLPTWGFEQQEVTCAKGGTQPNSVWYIESNEHPMLGEGAEKMNYRKPGFLGKFWELHKVMWRTNAGLVESHAWDSRPWSWPILRRGINFWGRDHRQIYLLGNPVVWWSSTIAIAIYALFKGIAILRWQRGYKDYSVTTFRRFDYEVGASVLGWAFHYFPFFLMQRQLFLHHYFPALYFAIMVFSQIFDFVTARMTSVGLRQRPALGQAAAVGIVLASVAAFAIYAPLIYGTPWTQEACNRTKLIRTWDYDCNNFFDSYAKYSSEASGILPISVPSSAAPVGYPVRQDGGENGAKAAAEGSTTPQPFDQHRILTQEEKIEFRDEQGNILNEEQIAALDGKVSFKTRYETRTRLVDAQGNELLNEVVAGGDGADEQVLQQQQRPLQGVAPPHPDVDGRNPETVGESAAMASDKPPTVGVDRDLAKEKSVESAESAEKGAPRPASDGNQATR